ncbi:MAG: bile acid:sodium symporter [Nibricoccus sp.]
MNPGSLRTVAILSAILLGSLIPQAQAGAFLIRWLIITMLFIVFLQTRLSREALQRSHGWLLAANIAMGFVGWCLGWLIGGRELALAGFFCGITPTASAAPVIMNFLRGRVDYVVAAFLLTNLLVAALLPVLMPLMLGRVVPRLFADVFGSVGFVVFVPLVVALLVRKVHPSATEWPKRLRNVSFSLWVATMFLITARVSAFLREHREIPVQVVLTIAALSCVLCVANFSLGRWIGGREFAREASQSLGQKNTAFTIYLALAYASPLVALGPTCYVLWHNLWNSWQLHQQARAESGVGTAKATH